MWQEAASVLCLSVSLRWCPNQDQHHKHHRNTTNFPLAINISTSTIIIIKPQPLHYSPLLTTFTTTSSSPSYHLHLKLFYCNHFWSHQPLQSPLPLLHNINAVTTVMLTDKPAHHYATPYITTNPPLLHKHELNLIPGHQPPPPSPPDAR